MCINDAEVILQGSCEKDMSPLLDGELHFLLLKRGRMLTAPLRGFIIYICVYLFGLDAVSVCLCVCVWSSCHAELFIIYTEFSV